MSHIRNAPVLGSALLLALIGCTEPRSTGPSLTVSLEVQRGAAPDVRLDALIEGQSVELTPNSTPVLPVAVLHLAPTASAPMTFVLRTSTGDTLARVSGTRELLDGFEYGVSAIVGGQHPLSFCAHLIGASVLRGTPSDTLFILFGGVPKGAIC